MSRRFRLTGSGAGVLAGVVLLYPAGLLLGYQVLVTLAVGGLGLLVAAAASLAVPPRVTLTRTVDPGRVTVGQPADGRLTVRNRSRLPAPAFTAVDRIGALPVEVPVGRLGPHEHRVIGYRLPAGRRGRFRLGPLTVARRDPLGLLELARRQAADGVLWVHPRVYPVRPLPIGAVLDYEGRDTDHATPGTVSFAALREYQAGDDPRHIHWRATARTGTLIVRENVDTTEPTTSVLLDARADALDADAFEHAVEVCAAVCRSVEAFGRPVLLRVVGEDPAALSTVDGDGLLDRLALAERSTDADPVALLDTLGRLAGGGALVVITGHREPAVLARLAEQCRRFSPVVVCSVLGEADPGDTGIQRRAGMAVLTVRTATQGVASWNRMVAGEPG